MRAEDEVAMEARLAQMETLAKTKQATIAALTIVAQQHRSAAVGGNILVSRSFDERNRFDGAKDAWTDWAVLLISCIQTVSPVLKKGMEHASTSDVPWSASVTDPNVVKESARLHYMLTQLMAGAPLDIVLNTGAGEGLEAWRRLIVEFDPQAATRTAGCIMEILRFHITAETSSLVQCDKLIREHERRTGKGLNGDVKLGVAMSNMTDVHFRDPSVLQSELRSEVADIVRTRAATSPVPMQVDAVWTGRAGKASKGEHGKDTNTDKDTGGKDANTCQDTKRKRLLRSGLAHGGLPVAEVGHGLCKDGRTSVR